MKTISDIIRDVYNSGKLSKEQVMFCISINYLQTNEAKDILGPEYIEEFNPPGAGINLEYEERLSALEKSTYNKEDIHKIINEIPNMTFPDIISGGNF